MSRTGSASLICINEANGGHIGVTPHNYCGVADMLKRGSNRYWVNHYDFMALHSMWRILILMCFSIEWKLYTSL